MKVFVTSKNTARIEIGKYLGCKGNKTIGLGGYRDKAESIGINWDDAKEYLINDFIEEEIKNIEIYINIETLDFEDLKLIKMPFEFSETVLSESEYYKGIKEVEVNFSEIKYISKM